jgi:hypothetical protein
MSSNKELLFNAIHTHIGKLRASLRYCRGLDRSDVLADIAFCERLLVLFKARQTLH